MANFPSRISEQAKFIEWTNSVNAIIDYVTEELIPPEPTGILYLKDTDNKMYELRIISGELVIQEADFTGTPDPLLLKDTDNSSYELKLINGELVIQNI